MNHKVFPVLILLALFGATLSISAVVLKMIIQVIEVLA